jgi:pimeloyl-ACP methyl ester carboxylesterase
MSFFHSAKFARFTTAAMAVLLLLAAALILLTGFSIYSVISLEAGGVALDPKTLLGNPRVISISGRGVSARDGIFFPGQTGGPTIILAPGFRSQSSALLTLVAAFQDNNYNVLIFDFSGHGGVEGRTTLGYRETQELLAAVQAVTGRDDVDPERIGIWGHDMGAYAAISAAAADGRIRAVAVDSAYDSPEAMFALELKRRGAGGVPVVRTLCQWTFRMLNFSHRKDPKLSERLPAMGNVAKLFIQGRDDSALAESTLALFLAAAEPRQQMVAPKASYAAMTDEEKRDYHKQVVSFFLQHLPPTGGETAPPSTPPK